MKEKQQLDGVIIFASLLLLALFAQLVLTSPHQSLTADEPVYIAAGYAYLRTDDLRLQPAVQHPPLMNVLEAWPLLLRPDAPDVRSVAGWSETALSRFIVALILRLGPVQATAFATRVPVMWLTVLLAACVYRWATDWGKHTAGLLALGLYAFDPNLIAHGSLATTDLGVTAFTFIALYGLMRFLRRPTWPMFLLSGIGLGLAMSAKSSGILLVVAFALMILTKVWRPIRLMAYLGGLIVLACLVVWAVMGFEVRTPPGWPVPLPAATYWLQVADLAHKSAGGQTAFLMGQISQHGWRTYYPIAFALKTPLSTLILLAISFGWLVASGKAQVERWLALGSFPVLYGMSALFSSFNTGYRFLLPMLPFVFVFIGEQVSNLKSQMSNSKFQVGSWRFSIWYLIFGALAFWYVVGAVRIFPHDLAYFNELAGGPDNGYHFLVDSNLDWGQSLIDLKAYLDQHGVSQANVSQYTYTDPAWYGISYSALAPMRSAPPVLPSRFDPAPGVYVIGATTLQGVMMAEPDNYEWFRHQPPTARLGHALFVYDVQPHAQAPTWVAQCTVPVAPLDAGTIAEGFGRADLRIAYFDCTQSWLLPGGGQSLGWYVLHQDAPLADNGFVNQWLNGTRLSYEQRTNRALPPFAIYEYEQSALLSAAWPLETSCSTAPVAMDGPLSFRGYTAKLPARQGDTLEVETCWQVTALPPRPLSLMLHLVAPDGKHIVADGLGVPIEQWQVGDIIVQRHSIKIPSDAPAGNYQLLTGAYWLDTLERWPILSSSQSGTDTLTLAPITVERSR
jgi:4-amino-4-deoxy-L-arabinose transferase-like glycosyltransferase